MARLVIIALTFSAPPVCIAPTHAHLQVRKCHIVCHHCVRRSRSPSDHGAQLLPLTTRLLLTPNTAQAIRLQHWWDDARPKIDRALVTFERVSSRRDWLPPFLL